MAAAVVMALVRRMQGQGGSTVRASLARTAHLLAGHGVGDPDACPLAPVNGAEDFSAAIEATSWGAARRLRDRKSTRLNSSHLVISYAVFCLKKKKKKHINNTRSESRINTLA